MSPARLANNVWIVPDSRWGLDPQAMSGALPQSCGPTVRELKSREISNEGIVGHGMGLRDSAPSVVYKVSGSGSGSPGGLGARSAGGRERDPCYDLGPSFATSYSGIHINHRQIRAYQATGIAMRYPQFKCWNSSVRRSRTYFPLISNGVSQHRCIRGKGAEFGTSTWPQWFAAKTRTNV